MGTQAKILVVEDEQSIGELVREMLIEVSQQQAYSPIYVKSTHGLAVV